MPTKPLIEIGRAAKKDDAIAGLKRLFKGDVDPHSVACAVLEPVQGEGGVHVYCLENAKAAKAAR